MAAADRIAELVRSQRGSEGGLVRIRLVSVFVEDQERAERFYTQVLGFVVQYDIPLGEDRWLTVVSPEEPDGAELLLEPNGNPIAETYQRALYQAGIPIASFAVDDIEAEHRRLAELGVSFAQPPLDIGDAIVAVFDDTCGNLIQIVEAA
jgi:catechol 2,3-dioxygenase-like lactoylglutathione lyase family enzyme